jgi:hypothetical protein
MNHTHVPVRLALRPSRGSFVVPSYSRQRKAPLWWLEQGPCWIFVMADAEALRQSMNSIMTGTQRITTRTTERLYRSLRLSTVYSIQKECQSPVLLFDFPFTTQSFHPPWKQTQLLYKFTTYYRRNSHVQPSQRSQARRLPKERRHAFAPPSPEKDV